MRLSEDRIDFLSEQVLDALLDKKMIAIEGRRSSVQVELNRAMVSDLQHEDKLDDEVRQMIAGMQRNIPEDTPEYRAIFLQKKEELARRDGYTI